jgi:hypothetical protein
MTVGASRAVRVRKTPIRARAEDLVIDRKHELVNRTCKPFATSIMAISASKMLTRADPAFAGALILFQDVVKVTPTVDIGSSPPKRLWL